MSEGDDTPATSEASPASASRAARERLQHTLAQLGVHTRNPLRAPRTARPERTRAPSWRAHVAAWAPRLHARIKGPYIGARPALPRAIQLRVKAEALTNE